jgi:hypothetical protein
MWPPGPGGRVGRPSKSGCKILQETDRIQGLGCCKNLQAGKELQEGLNGAFVTMRKWKDLFTED